MTTTYDVDVLAIGPHPDDVELFCGGLLASASERGYVTAIVDMTRGEKSSRGDVATRRSEAEAAARALGVSRRENLELPDGFLTEAASAPLEGDERGGSAVARLVALLRRLRPELVLVPWERERHPDHEAASRIATRALFFAGVRRWPDGQENEPFTARQVLYYPMRHTAEPTFVVDVSDAYDRKTSAIRCYESQVGAQPNAPSTLVSSALSLSSLEARDRFYGAHIGVAHGEPYLTRETLGLADPVAHFRGNTFARPLVFPERR